MRAEVILGFEPAPADQATLVGLSDVLRTTVRALADARRGFDRLGRSGAVWDGPAGAPLSAVFHRFSGDLGALEDSIVGCLAAVESWRDGVSRRQARVSDLVAAVTELPVDPSGQGRRTRLMSSAHEVAQEHERDAAALALAFEDLSSVAQHVADPTTDLASDLDASLSALGAALDDWIATEGPQLLRAVAALGDVAALTTVISQLMGVATARQSPASAEEVQGVVAKAPGSHRLIRALRQQWAEIAPEALPAASFAGSSADRSRALSRGLDDGGSAC